MGTIIKWVKEFTGFDSGDIDKETEELFEEKKPLEQPEFKKEIKKTPEPSPEKNSDIKLDATLANQFESDTKSNDQELENCQTIFIDPKSFADCKKIANYIKKDRMVTLNLEYLDSETAQRMMDFLMGAMLIKGASFIEISKKVYTSVPKTVKVHYDGKKNVNDKMYMNIREE